MNDLQKLSLIRNILLASEIRGAEIAKAETKYSTELRQQLDVILGRAVPDKVLQLDELLATVASGLERP